MGSVVTELLKLSGMKRPLLTRVPQESLEEAGGNGVHRADKVRMTWRAERISAEKAT